MQTSAGNATDTPVEQEDIPRSATRRSANKGAESKPLSAWVDLSAFVLLAEPGGGKSIAFEMEAKAPGGAYVKARVFSNLGPPNGWNGETLFIDGIDEMRADDPSRNGPLDRVIQRLGQLGRPRFRLSCREADWLAADQEALCAASPDGQLDALHLDPLNDAEVRILLKRHAARVPDADAFCQEAEKRSLDGLLRNPLLLNLLAEAVGTQWPKGRADVYRLACQRMVTEHNSTIQAAKATKTPHHDQTLRDAGLLCAVLLLAGLDAWVLGPSTQARAEVSIEDLPIGLGVKDAHAALSSKLFVAEGTRRVPRHRSIAEYLAARAIGHQVTKGGLPISRVLALMSGLDGGIVEPLRGLVAWLAVHCPQQQRGQLIGRDPLACVLYGDAQAFHVDDKRKVLQGLRAEAERFAWFRSGNWVAHPFGALGTKGMTSELAALLVNPDRSMAHQSLVDCALDAIRHGEELPSLLVSLEATILDSSFRQDVRLSALEAWLTQSKDYAKARVWLDRIRDGSLEDPQDELRGRLLDALYPDKVTPAEVIQYLHVASPDGFYGSYRHFWSSQLLLRTPEQSRPALADGLVVRRIAADLLRAHFDLPRLVGRLVAASLYAMENLDVARASAWLSIGLDEYGFTALNADDAQPIRTWLEEHPDAMKSLVAHGYEHLRPDPESGRMHFWSCEERLFHSRRPRDWYRWLLGFSATTPSAALAEYCFRDAAMVAITRPEGFELDMMEVEQWVQQQSRRWPQATLWLEESWSLPIDHHLRDQHRRKLERQNTYAKKLADRRAYLVTHLSAIEAGDAHPYEMHRVAMAYLGRFSDVRGETPEERVRDLLVGNATEANNALGGLEATLNRTDLPTVDEILATGIERRPYYIGTACLVGAELAHARDLDASLKWADDLTRRLVAFHLVNGVADAGWYKVLAKQRPELVAEVLEAYAPKNLFQHGGHGANALWRLARDDEQAQLARIVVPPLLRNFPTRAGPHHLRRLNEDLLPAAGRHLPQDDVKRLINERLEMGCLDSAQRIAWLLAGLRFAAHRRSRLLVTLIGKSRVRARRLGATMLQQSERDKAWPKLPAAAAGRIVEVLAQHTQPSPQEPGWVSEVDRLRDLLRDLINQLASDEDESAAVELRRLRELPALSAWRLPFDSALFDHIKIARAAHFEHANVEAVTHALSNQAPANSLDLAALLEQHLGDLQARLHGDDTNGLLHFWRDPDKKGQRKARTENECRDLLVAMRRDQLEAKNVSLGKETAQANNKRSDLRAETMVMGRRRVVPIEVKKADNPELWTAWRDQLERLYMNDPASEGVGIYLALWFGQRPRPDSQGCVPASPIELREQLIALVPAEARQRLRVCVLDLSLPTQHKRSSPNKPRNKDQKQAQKRRPKPPLS